MLIKYPLVLIASLILVQPVFADEEMGSDAKPCMGIVKPCLAAGYTRHGSSGKDFWKDCMKPLVMGKSVKGITVDPATVKTCRTAKIDELQNELSELKSAS